MQARSHTSIAVTAFDTGIRVLQPSSGDKCTNVGILTPAETKSFTLKLVFNIYEGTYVVELNMLIKTRQRVTRRTILAGTMS